MAIRNILSLKDYYIFQILTSNKHTPHRKLNIKSIIELNKIMQYLKTNFLTENGNWSIKKHNYFVKENNIDEQWFVGRINRFYELYSSRKKNSKTFECYLSKLNQKLPSNIEEAKSNKLKFKEGADIHTFLAELKRLKRDYLIGDHKELLTVLSNNIELGYSDKTLRNYYFTS